MEKNLAIVLLLIGAAISVPYYGARIGKFSTHFHDVRGEVYAVDDKTLFIKGFNYDGKGQDAVFWSGNSIRPDNTGFIIPNHKASFQPLSQYNNQDLILRLPEGKKVNDIHWLSVWSKKHSTSFGTLIFPKSLVPPRPVVIGPLVNTEKGVSSGDILVLDTQTFLVPDFSYDGSGKGAVWWVSRGLKPNMGGVRLREEGGSYAPLQAQKNKIAVITLPDGHSVSDYTILSVFSAEDIDDYGSVKIPQDLKVPPSPRTLTTQEELETGKFNCEMLNDNLGLEVRWLITGNDITIRLVGNIDSSEYMALGLSKDDTETRFDASDAVVAWLDSKGHVVDYFLENMEKCENGYGMCPDVLREGSEDNLTLLDAIKLNKTTIITFKRPLSTDDKKYDQNIYTDGPQAILWAVGPIQNDGLAGPPKLQTRGNLLLDFGREPNWNCPPPKEEIFSAVRTHENEFDASPAKEALESSLEKHNVFSIHCPSDKIFRAQMGVSPSTGLKVWFINGLPTPHLTVQRGMTYTFIVEGGMSPPNHHPLYITNNKEGGIYQSILEAKEGSEQLYAGVQRDPLTGSYLPTAEGRFCEWSLSNQDPESAVIAHSDSVTSALTLKCENGKAGTLTWTPNAETIDNVYYQSFTERNRGGKISIVDFCEETNPHYYLKKEPEKEKAYTQGRKKIKTAVEREDDASDLTFLLNTKDIVENSKNDNIERNDNLGIAGIRDLHEINHGDLKEIQHFSSIEDMINFFGTHDKYDSSSDDAAEKSLKPNDEIEKGAFIASDISKALAPDSVINPQQPHDESERSDKIFNQRLNSQGTAANINKIKTYQAIESSHGKRPHNPSATSNRQSHITQPPPDFKPQFEGGFVPLVMNSGKEKESVISKDFILPPAHLRRPHRPFLFNESIPFHGTFKPGIPDFSGFNISHYSQEDSSYPLNHLQDNLPLLSMPKPQIIQRPLTLVNGLPPELFHRAKGSFERAQIFRYPPRQQNPGFGGHQQRIFAQLPLRNRPSLRPMLIPHSSDEDLSEGSSQRVQVALQLPGNEKQNNDLSILQVMRVPGMKPQPEIKTNKIAPHIIQRRPDFVEDTTSALNSNRPKRPLQGKPFLQRAPNNKPTEPQGIQAPPQSGNLRLPLNIQRPVPVVKQNFHPPGSGFRRLPSVPPRQRHPFLQRPLHERFPDLSNFPKNIAPKQHIASVPDLELVEIPDGPKNANSMKVLGSLDELVDTVETNALLSKEKHELPLFLKSDEIEPAKSGQQQILVLRQQLANSGSVFQSVPQNFPGTIVLNSDEERNIKLVQTSLENHKPNVFHQSSSSDIQGNPFKDLPNTETETNRVSPIESSQIAMAIETSTKNENAKKALMEQELVDLIKNASDVSAQFTNVGVNSNNNKDKNEQDDIMYDEGDNEEIKTEIHPSEFGKPNLKLVNSGLKGTLNIQPEEKEALKPVLELVNVEHDDTQDFEDDESADSDYVDYNVPFGARLKTSLSGAIFHTKPSFEIPKKPDLFRKPHLPLPLAENPNPNAQQLPFSTTTTSIPKLVINRTPGDDTLKSSIQSNMQLHTEINAANASPSLITSNSSSQIGAFNSSLYFNYESPSRGLFNVPFTLPENFVSKYPGRKNILPSVDSVGQPSLPAKVPDNINLPHISENPPTHDNGTDYSILNHVLTLIGGPPNHNVASSQNSNS